MKRVIQLLLLPFILLGCQALIWAYRFQVWLFESDEVVVEPSKPMRIDPKAIPHSGPWYIKTDDDDVNMAFWYYSEEEPGFSIWSSCRWVPASSVLWVREVPDLDAMPIVTGSET